jgi:hypothetical protein
MHTREHLIALVEPTLEGETPLALATDLVARGGKATVMLVVTDRARDEFRRFADSENLGHGQAETIAVDRLTASYKSRVGGDDTDMIVADSTTSSNDLLGAATASGASSIVIPQHLATRPELHELVSESPVPVLIAPKRAA